MPKHTKFLAAAMLAIAMTTAMAMPVMAQEADIDTVVATVNGADITVGHLIVARRGLAPQYQNLPDETLFEGLLQQLIRQAVLSQSLEGDEPAAVRLAVENESQAIRANETVARIVASAVTEEAVQAAYDDIYANADPTPEFNASHILVETEEEAGALIGELEAGADFGELARQHSTGPSGPDGGQLGWFGPGAMVPSFEAAVTALEAGAISAPVQTRFGWHVVKLNDIREKPAPTLEQVRAEMEANVGQKAVEDFVASRTAAAGIIRAEAGAIDPAILSNPDILPD